MRNMMILAALVLSAGCDSTGPRDVPTPPLGARMTLTDDEVRLRPGDEYFVDVVIRDSMFHELPALPLTFTSSNTSVVTADRTGRLVARRGGIARVEVRAGSLSDTVSVVVHPPETHFEGVYVSTVGDPLCPAPGRLDYRFVTPDSLTATAYSYSVRYGYFAYETAAGRYTLGADVTVAHFRAGSDTLRFSAARDTLYVASTRYSCENGAAARFTLRHEAQPRAATLGLPASMDVVVGDRVDPAVTARDASGAVLLSYGLIGSGVSYVFDDTSVVGPEDTSGGPIARGVGRATLRATWGGVRANVTVNVHAPVAVSWSAVDAGSCGISTAGRILCWGGAPLGRTTAADNQSRIPRAIAADGQFRVVDVSSSLPYACALPAGAGAAPVCWGFLAWLATDETDPARGPTVVTGIARADTIAVGGQSACALDRSADEVWCWNHPFVAGLADGSYTPARLIARGLGAKRLTVGDTHACLLDDSGRVYCWGSNYWGQAGLPSAPDVCTGSQPCALQPTVVPTDLRFTRISAGWSSTCGVTTAARIACWGSYIPGFVSYQPAPDAYATCDGRPCLPVSIAPIPGSFADVAVGTMHGCALTTEGAAVCWGSGPPAGHTSSVEDDDVTPVGGALRFTSIAASQQTTCATAAGGRVYCWGVSPGAGPSDVVALPVEVSAAAP